MSDLTQRIADLSPEKRALLTQRLKAKRKELAREQAIPKREDTGPAVLSYAQQRLWFLDQWEPDSSVYNIPSALHLTGPLDVGALEQSLNEIVRRHEVLRTTFRMGEGQPVQVINPELVLPLPIVDLRDLTEPERKATVLRLVDKEAQRPFDLIQGPLLRASLLRLDAEAYVLLLTMHHIVSDAWSTGVLIREMVTLYRAFSQGGDGSQPDGYPSPLPDLPIQYADFAVWQREWLQGEVLEAQLDYWEQKLRHASPTLELPTDRPHPPVQTYRGTHYDFQLPQSLHEPLKALSRQEEATLFMTLLAAFQTLLHRYSGQDDINVGVPIANRNRAEIEGLIGFFVNTVVMGADLSGEPTFRELLNRVREVALEAYAHQDVPFEMLVERLQLDRDMSRPPLFQVMFALQDGQAEALTLPGLTLRPLEVDTGAVKFDLTLFLGESEDGLTGTLKYNSDLFDAATIHRMVEHFQVLLEGIVADPDRLISRLPILTETERQQVLVEWNDTATPYRHDQCVHWLFEAQVEQTPDACAVVFKEERLSYRELNSRANQLARYLRKQGVGPETLVGLCVERSLEMLTGVMGILKAGAAYLPLDPMYPPERLAFMLEDAQAPVLLTETRLKDRLPSQPTNQPTTIHLNTEWATIAQESDENLDSGVKSENLAYVIYTSGSTGKPKAAMVQHRSVINLATALRQDIYARHPGDQLRVSLNAPLPFDSSVKQLLMLLDGHALHVIPQEVRLDGVAFVSYIRRHRLDVLDSVPTQFKALLQAGLLDGSGWMPSIVLLGGEAVDEATWRVLIQSPQTEFYNVYGPAECTVDSTIGRAKATPARPTIGRAVANARLYVLDRHLQPVPVGVPGELHIGGAGVGRGYLNRPDLAAQRFIPDPFGGQPGARLYKTGDRVRYLPDGNLEFLGRVDHQVKVRGFRIEPEEVEVALREHPEVQEAIALAREDTPGDKRLVAYIIPEQGGLVPEGDKAPNVSELRDFVAGKLPEYMVPSFFVTLEALPLLPNGKVNRRALPAPEQTRPELEKPYLAPRTDLEHYLVAEWQEVLGIDRIGVHDNFFELGGTSIQAAILANRLQEASQEKISVRVLFLASTVAELAFYAEEYFPDFAARFNGQVSADSLGHRFKIETDDGGAPVRIDAARIAQMRELIPPLTHREVGHELPESKNPPALFILSPPRSGSTLLRVMLEGHPRLFAPPELYLLSFNTLAERQTTLSTKWAFWLEGAIQAVMEVKDCDAQEAERLIQTYEEEGFTTQQFYWLLQEWAGDRMLTDKTPAYCLDLETLRRAEMDFQDALYIHLIRHPYGTAYSFMEAKLDEAFFYYDHPFSRRELAELVWIVGHQNILEFLKTVPPQRQHRVAFEDLVTQPVAVMEGISQFVGLDYDPALVQPYEGQRMTEGIHSESQMVGDAKFLLRKKIDPDTADRWKKFHNVDFLSDIGWQVAEALGYARSATVQPVERRTLTDLRPIPRDGSVDLPLSFAQQRLWFLDQLEPDSASYNIPMAVRFRGPLDVAALRQTFNAIVQRHEVLRTTFPTLDGQATQVIASQLAIPLPVTDLSGLSATEREAQARRMATQEAQKPFDLAQGPLLRVRLLQLGAEEHVMLLTMHHIVSDAWSTQLFIQEVAALYPTFAAGQSWPSPDKGVGLPELLLQYADYAHWQREWLRGPELEDQLTYWKEQLTGAPPLLALPTDRPRPTVQTFRGARKTLLLSPELTEALKELSRQEGATLFMTLLAAFQTLLYRYSGQDDVSVGVPVANRNHTAIENLIGFFINTLVIRSDLSGAPSFRELLHRVRHVAGEAYAHQDVPFEMLVDELQPERNLSHAPLFQVMFAFQDAPRQPFQLPGLTVEGLDVDSGTAKFDLTLFMVQGQQRLRAALEYNTDLFDAETIERMLGHWQTLLEYIVANPDQSIVGLPLLSEVERKQLLVEWNDTAAPYPSDRCVHELFAVQAKRTPNAVAVAYEDQSLTYAELNRRANQLARYLQRLGVGPESLVGICTERSPEMVVALLGVLKVGGAYLPLDPTYPPERLAFMLGDAQVRVLLTQTRLEDRLPTQLLSRVYRGTTNQLTAIHLDTGWDEIAKESGEDVDNRATPDNLAYVIYTSGSTGTPKGVMVLHGGLVNYLTWCQGAYPVEAGQGAPVHSSISFDLTVTGLFAPLLAGRKVQLVPESLGVDLLSTALRGETNYSLVKITPAHLELLSHQLSPGEAAGRTRAFIIGGENLLAESIAFWQDAAPDTLLVNEYGPTETVVGCCVYKVPPGERRRGSVPIGQPIINTQLYILDAYMQPVPIGVVGELYIGGAGVARGYLERAELTAERFVPNPHSGEPGARMYKTGDLARYLPDGNIEFLGRIDHQVKVRGFRIELGEIEAVLSQHAAVGETVVLAREDTPGARRLVAYVVPRDGAKPEVGEMRSFLGEKLPEYMVPSAFVTLEALPLTSNGKVDRRALPAPDGARPELEAAYVAPRTPKEELLADLWTQLLGVEQVGVHDNFFELGGDSILTIQVVSRANQVGLKLTPQQLFQHPTVAGLAAVAETGPVVQAEQGIVEGPVPLTPIQRWFFELDLPEPHHWNQTILLEVREPLERELLETAVAHLLEHHDALRLRFERVGKDSSSEQGELGWRQVNVGLDDKVPFEWVDLSGLPEAAQSSAIEAQAAELQAGLDLTAGPLLRVAYLDLGAGRPGRLLMVVHHVVIDGVSWRILLEDLQLAYERVRQGEPVRLPPKTTSFQHWAQRLVAYAQTETVRDEFPYWQAVAQSGVIELPVDFPGGENTEASARRVRVSLSPDETQALLQEVPAAYGAEINDALLTALAQTVTPWIAAFKVPTLGRTVLVTLEGHGREYIAQDIDIARTVGWFTSAYPVALALDAAAEPGSALQAMKEQLRRTPQRGIGYGLLRYLCRDEAVVEALQTSPRPQLSFNYLGQLDQALGESSTFAPASESPGPSRSLQGRRTHLLSINGGIRHGELHLEWTYSENLHRRATIERLAEGYVEALRALIAHCRSSEAVGYTPSDFPDVELDQDEIKDLMAELGEAF